MPINANDLFLSLRRTIVPFVVGAVGASVLGPWLPDALVAEWATVLLASVYYLALRLLEVQFPKVGLLLGGRGIPTYTDPELERRAFEDFVKAMVALEEAGEGL
jgi:uncharacterized protein (DUF58 family)